MLSLQGGNRRVISVIISLSSQPQPTVYHHYIRMSSLSLHYSQMTVSIIVTTLNHSRHRHRHYYYYYYRNHTGHHLLSPLTSRPWNLSSLSLTRRHFNLLHPYHHRCNHHHQNLVFTVLLPPTPPTSLTIGFVLLFIFSFLV